MKERMNDTHSGFLILDNTQFETSYLDVTTLAHCHCTDFRKARIKDEDNLKI